MKGSVAKGLCIGVVLMGLATLALAKRPSPRPEARTRKGLPTDWSHRHLIFSQPRTAEQGARVQDNTRYWQQQQRRRMRQLPPIAIRDSKIVSAHARRHHKHRRGRRLHRDWSMDMGPGAHMGPNTFPAKFSFSGIVANCAFGMPFPDFVTFATGVAGSSSQASIVTYTNLYSGCSDGGLFPVPAVYWAYNTTGTVNTSPVLSLDGTQIAFTQTNAGSSSLVLLRWSAFNGVNIQAPLTPTSQPASSYFGCASPCMTQLTLGANDSNSSVFYDYDDDVAYVGDDSGILHKFSPVLNATPAEVVTGGWPAHVGSVALTSPAFDGGSGNVFVADASGFLYSVSSTGTVTKSSQLGFALGIPDGPILDITAGQVYVFVPDDGVGFAAVYQLPINFTAGATASESRVGSSTTVSTGTTPIYDGAFDNAYLTSANSTGNLYVCGNPGGQPTLYQIPVSAGVIGTAAMVSVVSTTSAATCSPVTDVFNPTVSGQGTPTEWVFLSTQAAGSPPPCVGFSCVMSFKTTAWQPLSVYNAGQEILDSNLNIQVADNSGGTSGATPPVWNTTIFGPTSDGTVHWRLQGSLAPPFALPWAANNFYTGFSEIVDSNNNIEITQFTGTSGATQPVWAPAEGGTTSDGTITWTNLGLNPIAALSESGGTSGIIIDNTVNSAGASQVYFSTLQDIGCFTSGGTGGCAVQASQQGLQ